jgi:hypothetical protein
MPRGHKHSPETLAKISAASRRPMAAQAHDAEWRTPDDYMDESMSGGDFVYVLENLRFRGGLGTLKLDKHARDYLVEALRHRHQPAST